MWHCRRAHFVILDFLIEIIHGDIGPKITIQINEYGIDPCKDITQGSQVIVMLNLRGGKGVMQSQGVFNKLLSKCFPINLGICHLMSIKVSSCPTKLCRMWHLIKKGHLLFDSFTEYPNFFSQSGWGSGLSVCTC